jgi:methyl-accepting chemotaxis protein
MVKRNHLDQEYLDLRAKQYAERTFLGGVRIATRSGLLAFAGVLALVLAGAAFVLVDQEFSGALGEWSKAQRMGLLVTRVERELERSRAHERVFLAKGERTAADQQEKAAAKAAAAVDALLRLPESDPVKHHLSTIRDGLAQHAAQFQKVVEAEKSLASGDAEGPRGRLEAATQALQAKLKAAGLAPLVDRVGRQTQKAEMLRGAVSDPDIALLRLEYEAIAERVQDSPLPDKEKAAIRDLLNAHRTQLAALLEPKMAAAAEAERLEEIAAYLAPSREVVLDFADKAWTAAPAGVEGRRERLRLIVAGSAAAAVAFVVVVGLAMLGSVASAVRSVAFAAGRLAGGERGVIVPARGNVDAVGAIARALDTWLDNLAEVDHLRAELEETKAKLEQALKRAAPAEDEEPAAGPAARAAGGTLVRYESPAPELPLAPVEETWRSDKQRALSVTGVSQQLAQASRSVSSAALDVERAEALLRAVNEATQRVDEMDEVVSSIRDQANLLVFRAAARGPRPEGAADNLVVLAGEPGAKAGGDAERETADSRLDAIRQASERAEETLTRVQRTLADVSAVAQDIAATASSAALEATSRLLHESEHLQSMLDGIVARLQPGSGERGPEIRELGLKPPFKSGPSRA